MKGSGGMRTDYDIIVVGGGPAGLVAAIAAARRAKSVLLVERYGFVGGSATMPMPILGFLTSRGERVIGGIPQEFIDRLAALGGTSGHFTHPVLQSFTPVDAEALKLLADRMLEEAGAATLLHATAVDVGMDGGRIASLSIETEEGLVSLRPRIVIDASGDGDVAHAAGVPSAVGRESDGRTQAMTVQFTMSGVDIGETRRYLEHHPEESVYPITAGEASRLFMGFPSLVRQARADGLLERYPRSYIIFHTLMRDDHVGVNSTKINCNALDPGATTTGEIEGRRQSLELVRFLQERIPGFSRSYLERFAPLLGVRETRRIAGSYVLQRQDVLEGRRPDDSIALSCYPIDIHDPTDEGPHLRLIERPYGIPFGCMVPREVPNLLVAGRCISATHEALSSVRAMANCMAMGQAAGDAAALCLAADQTPGTLDVGLLRRTLASEGAIL